MENLEAAARRIQSAADPECTHDLRVGARWLDGMLATWECLFPAGPRKAAIRSLRWTRRRLGRARELQVHLSMLEPRVPIHGAPVKHLIEVLKNRLSRRMTRAARLVRPKRLKRLLGRIEAAASGLDSGTMTPSHAFARARARALEAGALAQVALKFARTEGGDWWLHEARLAIKKWRYAVECAHEIEPLPEARVIETLGELQTALGTFQDRTTLIAEIERFVRREDADGLRPLVEELEAEKQAAVREFHRLATALSIRPPAVAAAKPARVRMSKPAAVHAPVAADGPVAANGLAPAAAALTARPAAAEQRYEHMTQWLLGTSGEK